MSVEQAQNAQTQSSAKIVFERMIQAANRHDLEAMVACFAPDFRSEQPFYPERNFVGQAGVRKNWSFFFSTMPDFQAEVLSEAVEGDVVSGRIALSWNAERWNEPCDAGCDHIRNSRRANRMV